LEFNQSEERKSISGLVNFVLIDQDPILISSVIRTLCLRQIHRMGRQS